MVVLTFWSTKGSGTGVYGSHASMLHWTEAIMKQVDGGCERGEL